MDEGQDGLRWMIFYLSFATVAFIGKNFLRSPFHFLNVYIVYRVEYRSL